MMRVTAGLTQRELALQAGIPQPNLSNFEKGKRDVMVSTLRRICGALGVRMSELFRQEEECAEPAGVKLSRPRIEALATAIIGRKKAKTKEDAALADLFKKIMPGKKPGASGVRELYPAWLRLRQILSGSDIESIVARVRDAQSRAA
ncbi:MAG: helix-turn-helix domain-containing protein [Candidatus Omnitrophota bacterium]|nr:helix-turn-helix domain-containing protein [Candidatus Omnitrophota bacterium]